VTNVTTFAARLRRSPRPQPKAGPTPTPVSRDRFTQDELRERRRKHLAVVYSGGFDLAEEIASICIPLAQRISALPNPQCAGRVVDLVEAVHELVGDVCGWISEIDARQRTEHLSDDSGRRSAAVRLMVDLAKRPALPFVGTEELASGSWSTALVSMSEAYSPRLADLLGRSLPPGSVELRGLDSRSEKLVDKLRPIDTAARELSRLLDRAEAAPRRRKPRATPEEAREAARAELRAMGIDIEETP
jgi:hypothetical protein